MVDVKLAAAAAKRLKAQPGRLVPAAQERVPHAPSDTTEVPPPRRHVVVVGAGPCGLFAALTLARNGHRVTLCERGKPVEERGKSIGALIKVRHILFTALPIAAGGLLPAIARPGPHHSAWPHPVVSLAAREGGP